MAVYNLSVTMQGAAAVTCTITTPKQGIDILPSVQQILADLNLAGSNYVLQTGMTVAQQVTSIFGSYNRYASVYPGLQDLYTRRQICWNLRMGVWKAVDYVEAGVDEKLGQYTTHYAGMEQSYDNEIKRIEGRAAASLSPSSGQMNALPPIDRRPGRIGGTYPGGPCGPWRLDQWDRNGY